MKTKANIECMNAKYKFAADKGKKDRFPDLRKSKLLPRTMALLKC
jgi:hypothetical protein